MSTTVTSNIGHQLLEAVYRLPHGKRILECLQCGTCSASCPSAGAMEYGPREVIAALRAGILDRVLNTRTVWLCVSCYACTVRCPAGIPFTDVMYELKRLEAEKGLVRHNPGAAMAHAFAEVVDRHGRNAEPKLLMKFYLRTNPLRALAQLPLALRLLWRGRMKPQAETIRDIEALRKMLATIPENNHS